MAKPNEVLEGLQYQGSAESVVRRVDTTNWGGSPTSPTATATVEPGLTEDLTGAVLGGGGATVNGNIITLPALAGLEVGKTYRVYCSYLDGAGNQLEFYIRVACKD